jgi:hypothetical protein
MHCLNVSTKKQILSKKSFEKLESFTLKAYCETLIENFHCQQPPNKQQPRKTKP